MYPDTLAEVADVIKRTIGEPDFEITRAHSADDFADWDSLAHVNVIFALEKRFGIKFTTGEAYQLSRRGSNIGDLTDMVESKRRKGSAVSGSATAPAADAKSRESCLVLMQDKGSKPPFFCVHGAGGIVIPFYQLYPFLGEERPFYGIQDTYSDVKAPASCGIPELASHYVSSIRRVQPHGPYYLGGLCFGGILALEMARLLQAQGEDVALLVMIGTVRSDNRLDRLPLGKRIVKTVQLLFQIWGDNLYHLNEPIYLQLASRRLRRIHEGRVNPASAAQRLEGRLFTFFRKHSSLGLLLNPDSPFFLNPQFNVQEHGMMQLVRHHTRLWRSYQPKSYTGRVLFIEAEKAIVSTEGFTDGLLGWGETLKGPVDKRTLPGCNHMNMTRPPYGEQLAGFIRQALGAAERQPARAMAAQAEAH
jgi:thioesterase domain-containing protein/acyl carrier protein